MSGPCFCRVAVLMAVMICRVMQSSANARKVEASVGVEVANGLVQADHSLLDDVLVVGADEEVGTRLGPRVPAVLGEQLVERALVASAGGSNEPVVVVFDPRGRDGWARPHRSHWAWPPGSGEITDTRPNSDFRPNSLSVHQT